MVSRPFAAVLALSSALGLAGASSVGAAEIDEPEVTDVGTGPAEVSLLETTAPAIAPGASAWIHLTWTGAVAEASEFRVTAVLPDGSETGYPENTVDHTSLYWDDILAISEIDYTALHVEMPIGIEVPLVLDVTVSYVSHGESMTESHTVVVPLAEVAGPVIDDWEFDPYGTDTATSGRWAFTDAAEEITWAGYTTQRGAAGLFTGPARGSDTGADDVDGGVTSALSPTFVVPEGGAELALTWYFAYLRNADVADHFTVWVVDGGDRTVVVRNNGRTDTWHGAEWRSDRFDLDAWAGRPVRFLVEVADLDRPSLIEAAVTDLAVIAR